MRIFIAVWLAAFSCLATAQTMTVTPDVAYEGQRIRIDAMLGACPYVPKLYGVTLKGRVITVNYRFEPGPGTCDVPIPVWFVATIGPFPPDFYELRLESIPDDLQPIPVTTLRVLPLPDPPPFAGLAFVSGNRKLVLPTPPDPTGWPTKAPFFDVSVRATDAAGAPVAGVQLALAYPYYLETFEELADEFGFPGFPAPVPAQWLGGGLVQRVFASTGATGVASGKLQAFPGSHVIGAGHWPGAGQARRAFATILALNNVPTGSPVVAVEFHHAAMGRYVLTANADEIAALDSGAFAGWERSTGAIAAWTSRESAPFGAIPVCRFFSPVHTSHFYTVDPAECDALELRWPGVWILETREAFWVAAPFPLSGMCAGNTQPVYRMYRAVPGPSHRFVTGKALRDAMIAAGWIFEGSKTTDRGAMCVPV